MFAQLPSTTSSKSTKLRSAALIVPVCLVVAVSGCERMGKKDELSFNGINFRSKAKMVDKKDRSHFTVNVDKATQSIEGAREAGRHAAVTYCIENYGSSSIDWVHGPDVEPENLRMIEDDLYLEGVCNE